MQILVASLHQTFVDSIANTLRSKEELINQSEDFLNRQSSISSVPEEQDTDTPADIDELRPIRKIQKICSAII
jgi:hypothetical protein